MLGCMPVFALGVTDSAVGSQGSSHRGAYAAGVSNLETEPLERVCATGPGSDDEIQVLSPRDVPLGGPRAMTVRRTLPQRERSLIGAWCFVDHYGPDGVAERGMNVPPHPHTGLQTVSWLFAGEIEHRDSTGAHAMVRPGELNLMTAGSGIQHSEVSTPETTVLHGAQLWTALPDAHRHTAPFFERYVPPVFEHQGASVSVFLGSLLGHTSTATAFSPIVGAQIDIPAQTEIAIPVDAAFEHGVLVDSGGVSLDDQAVPVHAIGYRAPGTSVLVLATGESPARMLLIGGEPLGEQIVMWWNFVGRSHDEVTAYRDAWQSEVIGATDAAGRFGSVSGYDGSPLPAPALPNVRLRPRG
ncbi:MAG: pirin [Cryobacterium sp.]|jgi:redox-sensitive bicupin YhaK (pirin superfamily)|nr:pirin [Cryobacterium sp.]